MVSWWYINRGWTMTPSSGQPPFPNPESLGYRTWLEFEQVPGIRRIGQYLTGPAEPFAKHGAGFVDRWNQLGYPTPEHGLPRDGSFPEEIQHPITMRVPYPAKAGATAAHEMETFGFRYRLRGPLTDHEVTRQFLRMRWEQAMSLEDYWKTGIRNWPESASGNSAITPECVGIVSLTINPQGTSATDRLSYSNRVDIIPEPELAVSDRMVHLVAERLLPMELNCPELYMFSGHTGDKVELCKASGTCEWKLKSASPAIGTFDHPTDLACSFTATTPGKNTIQLVMGGSVVWQKPTEVLDIISRATWGAHAADASKLTTTPAINGLTYHHSADTSDGAAEVLNIQEHHMSLGWYGLTGNGWGDIGYHFIMDKAGNIYQGRELESAPGAVGGSYTLGAHVEGQNTAAGIGICILGKYELTAIGLSGAEAFPAARQLALEKALSAISRRFNLTAVSLSYHQARAVSNPTACPGSHVIGKAVEIKNHVEINLQ
jgi:hypothetical protein